jgi:hypothetical protein
VGLLQDYSFAVDQVLVMCGNDPVDLFQIDGAIRLVNSHYRHNPSQSSHPTPFHQVHMTLVSYHKTLPFLVCVEHHAYQVAHGP